MDRTIVRDPSYLEPVPWNRSRAVVLVVPVSSGYILITYLHGRHDHGHGPVEVVERRSKSTGCEALLSVGTDYRSLELESPRSGRSTAYYTKKERDSELFWSLRGSRKRKEREGEEGRVVFALRLHHARRRQKLRRTRPRVMKPRTARSVHASSRPLTRHSIFSAPSSFLRFPFHLFLALGVASCTTLSLRYILFYSARRCFSR